MASVTPRRTVRPFEGRGTAPAAEFADEAADQNHDVGPGSLWLYGAQDAPDRIELGNEQNFSFRICLARSERDRRSVVLVA